MSECAQCAWYDACLQHNAARKADAAAHATEKQSLEKKVLYARVLALPTDSHILQLQKAKAEIAAAPSKRDADAKLYNDVMSQVDATISEG
jgi:hypothetical protein